MLIYLILDLSSKLNLNMTIPLFINEFRSSFRNTREFRMGCKEFWRTTFEAGNNYERFYLQLMETIHES